MTVRIVWLGTPRLPGEGTRIGAVRRPPRGVPKTRFAADFSVGCCCAEESRCHRSVSHALLAERGAKLG